MSVTALGFALGLGVMTPEVGKLDNPHLLQAERVYQELIYRDRTMFRQLYAGKAISGAHLPKRDGRKAQLIRKASAGQ